MCMIWLLAISLTVINLGCLLMTTIGLPGTWLMVLTTVVTAMVQLGSDRALFGTGVLIAVVGLAVLGEIAEFAAGLAGSKKAGGTRWGAVGALVGTVIGGIVGTVAIPIPVLGSLLGACLGAALGAVAMELYGGRQFKAAMRSGMGAGVGRFWGTVAKIGIGAAMWLIITVAAFWN
jgi:uncharacterized protein YqgC (DUF456 family)